MATETTPGNQTWISVGTAVALAGVSVLITNGVSSSPQAVWHWVGVALIAIGALAALLALLHQFRRRIRTIFLGAPEGHQDRPELGVLEFINLGGRVSEQFRTAFQPVDAGFKEVVEAYKKYASQYTPLLRSSPLRADSHARNGKGNDAHL